MSDFGTVWVSKIALAEWRIRKRKAQAIRDMDMTMEAFIEMATTAWEKEGFK